MKDPIITLPSKLYHDPEAYQKECDNIFGREWLLFGHEAALSKPGSYITRSIAGKSIFVIRDKEDELKAYHNVCRHRAAEILPEGTGHAAVLRCPYHGWVYDTNGSLRKAPDFGCDEKALCDRTSLFPVHVKSWRKMIFISLAEEPNDFIESLGDLPSSSKDIDLENFQFHSASKHALNCNWKTYVENYMEGYHIPTIHPGLNKEIDMKTYKVLPENRIARHHTDMRQNASMEGYWVWLWPYAALNVYKDGMNLELMVPTGPKTMELHYAYYFRDLSNEEANQATIETSFEITQEDIDICEAVQRNLNNGLYETGELSPKHETGLAYFQDLIRQATND
jgi:choline monooxygenase